MTERNDDNRVSIPAEEPRVDFENDVESPCDPLDEEITSYLDDELTEEERQKFERRLESEPGLKERFESYRSAWNALDLLVDDAPNVDVTESTVERLNSETQTELSELTARKKIRNRLFLSNYVCVSCAFVVLGYFLFDIFFPDVQERRVKDQNVVSRLAQLEAIGEFEYLVALSQTNFFAKQPRPASHKLENASNLTNSQNKVGALRSYEELSQDRSFYRLQQRFERLDDSVKIRWRLLWNQIENAPNRDLLLKTLDDYSEWLTNFANDEERERLQTGSIAERIAEVQRKNEELARFWDRFPSRQINAPNVPKQVSAGNMDNFRKEGKFESSTVNVASPSPFATQMLMLRNLLPEELRREDFRSVYQKYESFRSNNDLGEKDVKDIIEFLKSDSNVYDALSDDAKKYLESSSEDERRSVLSLITALCVSEKNASDYYRQNAFRRSAPSSENGFRRERNFANRQDVSIRELANDLRNASPNVRDYVTSRPAQEAQALLFGIHWGGGRIRLGNPPPTSNPASFSPNVPFSQPTSQQPPAFRQNLFQPDK